MEKTILLASFIRRSDLNNILNDLKRSNKIFNNKVFILKDVSNKNKLILTYNIIAKENEKVDFDSLVKGTISLHRKKDTNTLYTLNALNEVVKLENNNKIDKNFEVNWDKYRNCILIISKEGLVKIKTIIESIKEI